jgi:hypothetical protein
VGACHPNDHRISCHLKQKVSNKSLGKRSIFKMLSFPNVSSSTLSGNSPVNGEEILASKYFQNHCSSQDGKLTVSSTQSARLM